MLLVLPAFLFFLHSSLPWAVRPQDDAHQDRSLKRPTSGTSEGKSGRTKLESQGGNEVLSVGHSAALRRKGDKKRLKHSGPLAHSSLAQTGQDNSSQHLAGSNLAKLAGSASHKADPDAPTEQKSEPEVDTNGGVVAPSPAPAEQNAEPEVDTNGAIVPSPAPANGAGVASPDSQQTDGVIPEHMHGLAPTIQNKGELVDENPESGPVAELLNDPTDGSTSDADEAEQEMDDIITDVQELQKVFWKVGHKLERFYDTEGYRHIILNVGIYFAFTFIALGLYFMWFQHREVAIGQEFRYGICECMGDSRVCLCGICCPAIRWADTVSEEKAGFLVFSSGFLLMLGLGMMTLCPLTGALGWFGIVAVGVYYRQKIREKYGLESDTPASYIEDFFVWGCCGYCALCQEARQVDEYTKMAEEFPEDRDDATNGDEGSRAEGESY